MKKLFYLASLVLVLIGCTPIEHNIVDDRRNCTVNCDPPVKRIVRFGYDGHDYIRFIWGHGDRTTSGIVHDPDCHCHAN